MHLPHQLTNMKAPLSLTVMIISIIILFLSDIVHTPETNEQENYIPIQGSLI